MKVFGMGLPELILILAVVLVIFGPKNLPKLGGMLGRTVKKIRGRVEDDTQTDLPPGGAAGQSRPVSLTCSQPLAPTYPAHLHSSGPYQLDCD
ncbi:MAG: twin-arginine translocase TatA/TatE family subunit [Gordonibacter pamelaeae]